MTTTVWRFESSGDAYDACQMRDDIRTGDILVIESELVVGLAHTWPVAVTMEEGELHTVMAGALAADHLASWMTDTGITRRTIWLAVTEARQRAMSVRPEFSDVAQQYTASRW